MDWFAWSQTHQRDSPVSREMMLRIGGSVIRICAMALTLIGPAAWGISGIGMPSAFFPPRSVEFVRLKVRSDHQARRHGVVEVGLHAVAKRLHLLA